MSVSVETTSALGRKLTFGVSVAAIDSEVNERLQKAAKTVKMKGFRPGKVPLSVVRQQYGNEIRREVLGEAVNKQFATVVNNNKLRVAGSPNIDVKPNEMDEELLFVATFEIFPEIELQDYSSVTVEKPKAEVTEADIDRMVEVFRKQQVSWEVVDRAAAEGDRVIADYTGIKDGVAFEGGTAEAATIEIGAKRMIPGFEEAMVGLKAGDEKTAPVTFPETYHNEALKGAAVDFKFKVKEVQGAKLPELNAEFFAAFGVGSGNEADFRKEIRLNMERELKMLSRIASRPK